MHTRNQPRGRGILGALSAFCLSSLIVFGQKPNQVQLLIPNGTQHAWPGATDTRSADGQWIGMIYQNGRWIVRDVAIKGSILSPVLRFAFVIRGIPGLESKSKLIYSADGIPQYFLDKGMPFTIDPITGMKGMFNSIPFEIKFSPYNNCCSDPPSSIEFRFLGQKQIIQCQKGEDTCALVWAGDIDFDGKPDFLIYTSDDNGGWRSTLYLSTLAKPGELPESVRFSSLNLV